MQNSLTYKLRISNFYACLTALIVSAYSIRLFPTNIYMVSFYLLFASYYIFPERRVSLSIWTLFISSMMGGILYSAKSGFAQGHFSVLSPIISVGIGLAVYKTELGNYWVKFLLIGVAGLLFYIVVQERIYPASTDSYLRGSTNHYFTYALAIWFLLAYSLKDCMSSSKEFILIITLVCYTALVGSTGGILVGLTGLIIYLFGKSKLITLVAVFAFFLILINLSVQDIDGYLNTKFLEKLEHGSPRFAMWKDFLTAAWVGDIFVGRMEEFNFEINGVVYHNLHNSFLLAVQKYGLLISLLQFSVACYAVFKAKLPPIISILGLLILLRSAYDTVLLSYGYLDWIFYLMLLHIKGSWRPNRSI